MASSIILPGGDPAPEVAWSAWKYTANTSLSDFGAPPVEVSLRPNQPQTTCALVQAFSALTNGGINYIACHGPANLQGAWRLNTGSQAPNRFLWAVSGATANDAAVVELTLPAADGWAFLAAPYNGVAGNYAGWYAINGGVLTQSVPAVSATGSLPTSFANKFVIGNRDGSTNRQSARAIVYVARWNWMLSPADLELVKRWGPFAVPKGLVFCFANGRDVGPFGLRPTHIGASVERAGISAFLGYDEWAFGSVSADGSAALVGTSATSAAGTIGAAVDATLSGQPAGTAAGTAAPEVTLALTGASAGTATGAVTAAATAPITGTAEIALSELAGESIATDPSPDAALIGVSSSATVGVATVTITLALTGVSVGSAAGQIAPVVSATPAGQAAGTATGSVASEVAVTPPGRSAGAAAGTPATEVANAAIGNAAGTVTGTVGSEASVTPAGQSAGGAVGALGRDIAAGLSGVAAGSTVGAPGVILDGQEIRSLVGLSAGTTVGSPATAVTVALSGVTAGAQSGSVTPETIAALLGRSAGSAAGSPSVGITVTLPGVGTVTSAGDLGAAVQRSLAGVQALAALGSVTGFSAVAAGTSAYRAVVEAAVAVAYVPAVDARAVVSAVDNRAVVPYESEVASVAV